MHNEIEGKDELAPKDESIRNGGNGDISHARIWREVDCSRDISIQSSDKP